MDNSVEAADDRVAGTGISEVGLPVVLHLPLVHDAIPHGSRQVARTHGVSGAGESRNERAPHLAVRAGDEHLHERLKGR